MQTASSWIKTWVTGSSSYDDNRFTKIASINLHNMQRFSFLFFLLIVGYLFIYFINVIQQSSVFGYNKVVTYMYIWMNE